MAIYKNKWKAKQITLLEGVWPHTLVTTGEAAAILNCSSRMLERYRQNGSGPEPEPVTKYIGNPRYYRMWKLITWRSSIVGEGPNDENQVWEWFTERAGLTPSRGNPQERPTWWPRGMRGKKAKSRKLNQIRIKYWELEARHLEREFTALLN